jgi:hypothetical protein
MIVLARHVVLALVIGPAAYVFAGRRTRAVTLGLLVAACVLGYPYTQYLQAFANLNTGGDSARELTNTAIQANFALLHGVQNWLPGAVLVLGLCNLACAADLAWLLLRQKSGGEPALLG